MGTNSAGSNDLVSRDWQSYVTLGRSWVRQTSLNQIPNKKEGREGRQSATHPHFHGLVAVALTLKRLTVVSLISHAIEQE